MRQKVAIPEADEIKRRTKMAGRLAALFVIFDFALLGIIVYEILQLL